MLPGTRTITQPPSQCPLLQDVDREQLSQTVLKLISSVASTAPTDDKSRDAVWHPTTTLTVTQHLHDPLGFGKIDVINMRLVGHTSYLHSYNTLICGRAMFVMVPTARAGSSSIHTLWASAGLAAIGYTNWGDNLISTACQMTSPSIPADAGCCCMGSLLRLCA